MKPEIEVRSVSKEYKINSTHGSGHAPRLTEALQNAIKHPLRSINERRAKETFWALQDVSFNVDKGEVCGIIGRNGAGKSTLLKVLSQITYPTTGEVILRGRVGSLLEVGTGFHADLTGRENIYLNGAILGMRKREIESKFNDIVKFAEVEKFLDTPVKRYSSGMHLRLAFAVAAHLEPDILIADEVLAVGDQQFQNKCLGKMKTVSQEGRTVIFVSHDMHAIRTLCNKGVLLKSGRIAKTGDIENVIQEYAATMDGQGMSFPVQGQGLRVDSLVVMQRKASTGMIDGGHTFEVVVRFDVLAPIPGMRLGISINSALGDELLRSDFSDWNRANDDIGAGSFEARLELPEKMIMAGNYFIAFHARRANGTSILEDRSVERAIGITSPIGFNAAEGNDANRGRIIINRAWEIKKI